MTSTQTPLTLSKTTPVHFVGVGGIGMSGLAKLLLEAGFEVSGSDLKLNQYTEFLKNNGATLHQGHDSKQVPDGAVVVVTTAASNDNPEIVEARNKNLPVFHRSDLLREILEGEAFNHNIRIGITGTHGKTSTTGMTGHALAAAGVLPTVVAGGLIPGWNTNACFGQPYDSGKLLKTLITEDDKKYHAQWSTDEMQTTTAQVAVAELDESDGTLIKYRPTHALLTNLELDHPDFFSGGLEALLDNIRTFLKQLPNGAHLYLNVDCQQSMALLDEMHNELATNNINIHLVGLNESLKKHANYNGVGIHNICEWRPGCFEAEVIDTKGQSYGKLRLKVPGQHNLYNTLFALAVSLDVGKKIGFAGAAQPMMTALYNFKGMGRRFERLGYYQGALLVDDYAHHPTEIKATLQAAKQLLQGSSGRLLPIFEPHRYTRLKTFWSEFLDSFSDADRLYIVDVFEASEPPIEGINSKYFSQELQIHEKHLDVNHFEGNDWEELNKELQLFARPGDIIITLGAGKITYLLRDWEDVHARPV